MGQDCSGGPAVRFVELHGDVDAESVEMLRDRLADTVRRNTDVLVDLTDVTLIDCTCLGALVEARQLAAGRGHRVCLVAPRPVVRQTLAATMLDTAFPVYPDRDRALSDLSTGAVAPC
ncbi:STAS domain-containing protein [Couchioplanes caeruleus]|uniref:STAS domain-containing protein n=1 Tax=Couchioplanes caeruleus TaxID=56438 RepID=UPI0020BFACDE|nr:STAS domain-containing protein [Couchioplanes caeruleus]UQU62648.1 STAS domain-containing protein [Couchioplanes caeruleus]